jgi:hypothetical protein
VLIESADEHAAWNAENSPISIAANTAATPEE